MFATFDRCAHFYYTIANAKWKTKTNKLVKVAGVSFASKMYKTIKSYITMCGDYSGSGDCLQTHVMCKSAAFCCRSFDSSEAKTSLVVSFRFECFPTLDKAIKNHKKIEKITHANYAKCLNVNGRLKSKQPTDCIHVCVHVFWNVIEWRSIDQSHACMRMVVLDLSDILFVTSDLRSRTKLIGKIKLKPKSSACRFCYQTHNQSQTIFLEQKLLSVTW